MKQRAVIGIEISPEEVRGACVRLTGGSPQLTGIASVPTPAGGMDSEGFLDAQQVGDAVRRVCAQLDPKASHVVVGITACNLVARVMEIPPVPNSEVRAVLRGEMDHYRILPAGQSAFDFYRLPDAPAKETHRDADKDGEGEAVARVLLMGAEERVISSYRSVIDAGHMNLVAVEPGSIAVIRALYPVLRAEKAVATVIVSATGTDVFITQQGDLQFYRRVDTGVPELRTQQRLGEGPQHSAAPQARGGLLAADDDEEFTPLAPAAPASAAEPYNRQAISLLMTEVQRSLDYFTREFPIGDEPMLVRFAIDSADASDLFTVMTQYLRSEAEMASPLDSVYVGEEARGALAGPQGYRYTTAVGLALRGSGGDYAAAPCLDLGIGDRVIVERRVAPRAMFISAAATGLILVGTIAAAFVVGNSIGRAEQRLTQQKHELQALTAEHAAKVAVLDRQKNLVDVIHGKDKPMREAVEFVAAAVSRRAALTTLSIDNAGLIMISGEATNSRIIADIMDTINLSPVLDPVRLNNIMRSPNEQGPPVYHFDMQTTITKPILALEPAVLEAAAQMSAEPAGARAPRGRQAGVQGAPAPSADAGQAGTGGA